MVDNPGTNRAQNHQRSEDEVGPEAGRVGKTGRLLLGYIVSPLATAAALSASAICLVRITADAALPNSFGGIDRLFLFSIVFSYIIAVVVGIPVCVLSIRRQWHKLWQNALAGFLAGLGLGVISLLIIISRLPSFKWLDPYSPFVTLSFFGLVGSLTMAALWPFIDHEN